MSKQEGVSRMISLWKWTIVAITIFTAIIFWIGASSVRTSSFGVNINSIGILLLGFSIAYLPQNIMQKGWVNGLLLAWALGVLGWCLANAYEFAHIFAGVVLAAIPAIVAKAVRWVIVGFKSKLLFSN